MSERKAFLEKAHIKNFLSLRNVTLPFKPLTVLVGPNASGKSNVLEALHFLNWMLTKLSPTVPIQGFFYAGEKHRITFQSESNVKETTTEYEMLFKIENTSAEYRLVFNAENEKPFIIERLSINNVPVISMQNGLGKVQAEDGTNQTKYKSKQLALESAGNNGNKPFTNALTQFIKYWKFYDFAIDLIKLYIDNFQGNTSDQFEGLDQIGSPIKDAGSTLSVLFSYWHENDPTRFNNVNESLFDTMDFRIEHSTISGINRFCLIEKDKKPIPIMRASEGTLRLLAYYILVNLPELPPLIAIEEPERNLHPGALKDIANILEQLAERTQVIITTHSSQLLDNFDSKKLSDSLGVLLLRNRSGIGTEVLNLEEIRDKREALDGWIADFGIGSAIFDSELLQDLMEEPI